MDAREVIAEAVWRSGAMHDKWGFEKAHPVERDVAFEIADKALAALAANQLAVVGSSKADPVFLKNNKDQIVAAWKAGYEYATSAHVIVTRPPWPEPWNDYYERISPSPLSTGDRR